MNISKKTRKKIQSILLSDHFGESGEYISMQGFSYTPASDSPLSVIWKKFVVRLDGEIIGYLMGEEELAESFYEDAAILTIINMWNDELQESDYSFSMQDIPAAILEGETK